MRGIPDRWASMYVLLDVQIRKEVRYGRYDFFMWIKKSTILTIYCLHLCWQLIIHLSKHFTAIWLISCRSASETVFYSSFLHFFASSCSLPCLIFFTTFFLSLSLSCCLLCIQAVIHFWRHLSPSFYQHTRTYTYLYGLWFIRSAYGTSASSSPPILRERRAARLNYKLPHIFRYEINVKS